jgi:hypothetical protein
MAIDRPQSRKERRDARNARSLGWDYRWGLLKWRDISG